MNIGFFGIFFDGKLISISLAPGGYQNEQSRAEHCIASQCTLTTTVARPIALRVNQLRPCSTSNGSTSSERDLFYPNVSAALSSRCFGDVITRTYLPDKLVMVTSGGAAMMRSVIVRRTRESDQARMVKVVLVALSSTCSREELMTCGVNKLSRPLLASFRQIRPVGGFQSPPHLGAGAPKERYFVTPLTNHVP